MKLRELLGIREDIIGPNTAPEYNGKGPGTYVDPILQAPEPQRETGTAYKWNEGPTLSIPERTVNYAPKPDARPRPIDNNRRMENDRRAQIEGLYPAASTTDGIVTGSYETPNGITVDYGKEPTENEAWLDVLLNGMQNASPVSKEMYKERHPVSYALKELLANGTAYKPDNVVYQRLADDITTDNQSEQGKLELFLQKLLGR